MALCCSLGYYFALKVVCTKNNRNRLIRWFEQCISQHVVGNEQIQIALLINAVYVHYKTHFFKFLTINSRFVFFCIQIIVYLFYFFFIDLLFQSIQNFWILPLKNFNVHRRSSFIRCTGKDSVEVQMLVLFPFILKLLSVSINIKNLFLQ